MGGATDYLLYRKINILYYFLVAVLAAILASLPPLVLNLLFHLNTFWLIIFFLFGFIFVDGVLNNLNEEILDWILPKKMKKRIGFYRIRWHSKDYDLFVGTEILELINDSKYLLDFLKEKGNSGISDFSFIVLPYAKAFEGVLKKILVDANLLSNDELVTNPDVSINKYFNPATNDKIFELLRDKKRDKTVPYVIFSTYQECRNQILHYDPYRDFRLKNIDDAEFYIRRIDDAMIKTINVYKNPHNP